MRRLSAALAALRAAWCTPAEPRWFDQLVDHFSPSSSTYSQRYYANFTNFKGPGSPIFVILGGEGGIPPDVGIFYPWVTDVLAAEFGAAVLEPEHRFYGESLPVGPGPFSSGHLPLMSSQQALADAALFIRAAQRRLNCTQRGSPGYCPVLTIGGSYPGFLSAMMRLRYPAVVDMAYAASAPMRFYSQEVGQFEYYARVSASAERAHPGCPAAVLRALEETRQFLEGATGQESAQRFRLCESPRDRRAGDAGLADDLLFLAEQTFANLNMANYPPGSGTGLARTCAAFAAATRAGGRAPVDAVRDLLAGPARHSRAAGAGAGRALVRDALLDEPAPSGCLNLSQMLPGGPGATARCGDWSGCGAGSDGEVWDLQTCTFEVEHIGFDSTSQMFPSRAWTLEWLEQHCARRFGVRPQPRALVDLWGFDTENLKAQASRIIFTNGLNDGWSVGGILTNLSEARGLVAINLPNGAHHSDLSHAHGDQDTPDVVEGHLRAIGYIAEWLGQVRETGAEAHKSFVV